MKTIRLKTENKVEWIINVKQITCLSPNEEGIGTFIYLSCGKMLHTLQSVNSLLADINRGLDQEDDY